MIKIQIGICDDIHEDSQILKEIVDEYMHEKEYKYDSYIYGSGELILSDNKTFDVVFMDIDMGDGINGIITSEKLRNINRDVKIIFVTSFGEYINQAVNSVHAFAYLSKPINKSDVYRQLDEACSCCTIEPKAESLVKLMATDMEVGQRKDTLIRNFNISEIYYFEYSNRKVKIVTISGIYFCFEQMKNLAELMERYNFESCHQSFLVNLAYVRSIRGYELIMNNGDIIPVSQKKSASFRKRLNLFVKKSLEV